MVAGAADEHESAEAACDLGELSHREVFALGERDEGWWARRATRGRPAVTLAKPPIAPARAQNSKMQLLPV
jgi:hypothetical protein